MKQHGNDPINPVKFTVTFTYTTNSGISFTRETDAEGFRSYVPVFPRPVITADRTCIDGEIQVNFDPDQTKYPTAAQYKIYEDGVAITGSLGINTNYSNLLTGRNASSHSYYALVDVDGFANSASDAYNVTSLTSASGIFIEPPTIGDFSVAVVNNAIEPTFTNFSLNDYPSATVSIVVDGPGVNDTQSFVVTDFSDSVSTPVAVPPGTYNVRLHVEYGGCAPFNSRIQAVTIQNEENPETPYPAPSYEARKVCTDNQEIGLVTFTYGTPSASEQPADPSGPYPSYAKIILLDSNHNPVQNVEPYPILTTPSINVAVPGSYYISIDIDGDGIKEEGDPESSLITFEAEEVANIDLIKLSVLNKTITPEYKVSYSGSNALEGTIKIMGPNGFAKTIILDSETFAINQDKILEAISGLKPGTYNATLMVDYGCGNVEKTSADVIIPTDASPPPAEPPVVEPPAENPPVVEPPAVEPPTAKPTTNEPEKLTYTGLEYSFFESVIMNIKEVILSVLN